MSSNPVTVTYFELHTADLARAQAFYGQLFSWKIEDLKLPHVPYFDLKTGSPLGGGSLGSRLFGTPAHSGDACSGR